MAATPTPQKTRDRAFDPLVFGVSATLTILFVLWSAIFIATFFPLMFLLLWLLYGTFKGLSTYRKTEGQG